MKKRILAIMSVAMALFALLPVNAFASDSVKISDKSFSATRQCAVISTDGNLYMWGDNEYGQLGLGAKYDNHIDYGTKDNYIHEPTKVEGLKNVVAVFTSAWSSAAITADGSLYTWGRNEYGQLGLGDKNNRSKPTKVQGLSSVVTVSLGSDYSAAITANGDLYTWGRNEHGQLGLGKQNADVLTPTKVNGISNAAAVSVDEGNSAVITNDGSLYIWGQTELGLYPAFNDIPTKANVPSKVINVMVSYGSCIALTVDGSVYTWGGNGRGQLGLGDYNFRATPSKVKSIDNVTFVSINRSGDRCVAVTKNGSLYAWGGIYEQYSSYGKYYEQNIPAKIEGLSNIASAGIGGYGSYNYYAITTDGNVYTWGFSNTNGELGRGNSYTSLEELSDPAQLEGITNVIGAGFNFYNSFFITADGLFYGAGYYNVMWKFPWPAPYSIRDTDPQSEPPTPTATPTASTVLVNGKNVSFDAYNIGGNNYFKLRDLAYILSGTQKQFEVEWDAANNAIKLTSGKAYTAVGGEMTGKGGGSKAATPTASKIYLDGKEVTLTAYNIDGNNYFKLRDIGAAFDFGVTWDGAKNTIVIDTSIGYTPG